METEKIECAPVSELLPGVKVFLWIDNDHQKPIVVDQTIQYVGRNITGINIGIELTEDLEDNVIAFHVNGNKDVSRKAISDDGSFAFQCKVPVKRNEDFLYTVPGSNNIRLARINTKCLMKLFRISVISQRGEFYVAVEKTAEHQAYIDDADKMVFPSLNWPSLEENILRKVFENWTDEGDGRYVGWKKPLKHLLGVEKYQEPFPPSTFGLNKYEGRVLWYSIGDGIGAVLHYTNKIARVHWSQIKPRCGLAYLTAGEVVCFDFMSEVHQGDRPTTFKWELEGVTPGKKVYSNPLDRFVFNDETNP